MKIGSRNRIDSFMPRRFRYSSSSVSSNLEAELDAPIDGGSSENKRVDATRHRYRDRQHVVDDERAAGDQTGMRAQQARRDLVAAAPDGNSSITWL